MRNEVVIRRELPDGGRLILTVETPEPLHPWAMASLASIAQAMKDYTATTTNPRSGRGNPDA